MGSERAVLSKHFTRPVLANSASVSTVSPCVPKEQSLYRVCSTHVQASQQDLASRLSWATVHGAETKAATVSCRSREDAFKIGAEIAQRVTASNPAPVTLKFEKVYHPCVLLTKKRYVGYMYESPKQVRPLMVRHEMLESSAPEFLPPSH